MSEVKQAVQAILTLVEQYHTNTAAELEAEFVKQDYALRLFIRGKLQGNEDIQRELRSLLGKMG